MARATLEMFLKLIGADKTSKDLDKVSGSANRLDKNVKNSSKANAQFAAGMSGLTKGAIAGAAIFAGKSLLDFSADALEAAVSAEEAAAAFGTTFGNAAQDAARFTDEFANKAGLTSAELKQLLATTGAVAQGIGFTQKESADLGIELTKIAADVASFSNISAGAEPVLLAFRSALLGEREALKTYGIAISEAEVQTKAFELTGKNNANALTRQEKAYATLAVIQQKAAVQIGDLDRTSESFANQQRAVSAEIRQLKEDIGAELIPAAAEMLPIFRELVNDIAPPTIKFFKEAAQFSAELALSFEALSLKAERLQNNFPKINAGLERYINFLMRITPQGRLLNSIEDLAEKQRELNVRTNNTAESMIAYSIAQGLVNKNLRDNRNQTIVNTTQTAKFGETIDKKLNPIFGEQNSLILTNIQLETNRNTLMKLITGANQTVAEAQTTYNDALKEVNRLTIEENVRDAEAAKRKAELQTQIAILTKAQTDGKDVSIELALAQAQLAKAEYEIANNSPALIAAREVLKVAEEKLESALDNQKKAVEERNKALYDSQGFLEDAGKDTDTYTKKVENSIKKQNELLRKFREIERSVGGGFTPSGDKDKDKGKGVPDKSLGDAVETPPDTLGDQSNVDPNKGGGGGTQTFNFVLELDGEELQKYQIKGQQQGKTFNIVGQ